MTARLKHINPLGQVDVPLVSREGGPLGVEGAGCLEPGEEFEVSDGHALILLDQDGNYAPVDANAKAIFEQILAGRVVPDEKPEGAAPADAPPTETSPDNDDHDNGEQA